MNAFTANASTHQAWWPPVPRVVLVEDKGMIAFADHFARHGQGATDPQGNRHGCTPQPFQGKWLFKKVKKTTGSMAVPIVSYICVEFLSHVRRVFSYQFPARHCAAF